MSDTPINPNNIVPLTYWRHTRYRAADVQAVGMLVDKEMMALLVNVDGNGGVQTSISQKTWERKEGYFASMVTFFAETLRSPEARGLRGTFLVWLEDGMWDTHRELPRRAPMLAFCRKRSDPYTFLLPDPVFLQSLGYIQERAEISAIEQTIGWQNKKPAAFWRGSGSGIGMETHGWMEVPRVKLSYLSKQLNDKSKLDAAISEVLNYGAPELNERVHNLGIAGEHRPFPEFLRYKYLIDVDGYANAWKSCFTKLCSSSVVLKIQSEWEQWYYNRLLPWVHYAPVRSDLSDIVQIIDWCRAHDQQCQQMVLNAHELVHSLTFENAKAELIALLREILDCQIDR